MRYTIISLFLFSLLLLSIFIPFSNSQDTDEPFAQFINLRIEAIGSIVAEVEPTSSHIFYFKFYNGGYFQTNLYAFYVEFKVTVVGEGWTAYVSPTWTFFYPNETKVGHVYVTASARPSNYATIHLYGKLRDIYGNWHHANYTFHVKSAPYHSFDVLIEKPYIKAKQEGIYSVPIKIINYGNYEDYFEITPVYIPPNWHCIVSQNKVILSPKQETTVYIYFVTPPEGIYKQGTTHMLLVEVRATKAVSKVAAIVVMVEGFHLTLGQTVAILSSLPTLIAFISVGFAFHRVNSPSYIIPKPWKEEKEELAKLNAKERKKILKEMKEEWLSAIYFYKDWKKFEKQQKKLKKIAVEKQRKLENKIKAEWNEAWLSVYNAWKEECKKIKEEYEARKKKIQELYEKVKRLATKMAVKIEGEYRTWKDRRAYVTNVKASVYRKICQSVRFVHSQIDLEEGYIDDAIRSFLMNGVGKRHIKELKFVKEHLKELQDLAVEYGERFDCRLENPNARIQKRACVFCKIPWLLRRWVLEHMGGESGEGE